MLRLQNLQLKTEANLNHKLFVISGLDEKLVVNQEEIIHLNKSINSKDLEYKKIFDDLLR